MSVATQFQQQAVPAQKIPEALVYEVVGGRPIYYKGYKDVLNGIKTNEEIKMESTLQSWLKAKLTIALGILLAQKHYEIMVGELGLNLSKDDKRGADISIFKAEQVVINERFSNLPPEVIIEIDLQAEMEDMTEMDYVLEKIQDYLDFGVKKVIWVFSKNKNVMVATAVKPWLTFGWETNIEIVEDVFLNLNDLAKSKKSQI